MTLHVQEHKESGKLFFSFLNDVANRKQDRVHNSEGFFSPIFYFLGRQRATFCIVLCRI